MREMVLLQTVLLQMVLLHEKMVVLHHSRALLPKGVVRQEVVRLHKGETLLHNLLLLVLLQAVVVACANAQPGVSVRVSKS